MGESRFINEIRYVEFSNMFFLILLSLLDQRAMKWISSTSESLKYASGPYLLDLNNLERFERED